MFTDAVHLFKRSINITRIYMEEFILLHSDENNNNNNTRIAHIFFICFDLFLRTACCLGVRCRVRYILLQTKERKNIVESKLYPKSLFIDVSLGTETNVI